MNLNEEMIKILINTITQLMHLADYTECSRDELVKNAGETLLYVCENGTLEECVHMSTLTEQIMETVCSEICIKEHEPEICRACVMQKYV